MLTFTSEQMGLFQQDLLHRFVEDLALRARKRHPERAAEFPGDELVRALTQEVQTAKKLGLRTKGQLRRFSDLSMTFGCGFAETEDWARGLFARAGMTPAERLTEVEQSSVFVLRGRANGLASS